MMWWFTTWDRQLRYYLSLSQQTSAAHIVKRRLDTSDMLPGFCPRVSYSFVSSTDGKFKEHKIPKLHRSVLSHCRQLQGSCDNSCPAFQYFFTQWSKEFAGQKKLSPPPELTPLNLEASNFLSFSIFRMNDLQANGFSLDVKFSNRLHLYFLTIESDFRDIFFFFTDRIFLVHL